MSRTSANNIESIYPLSHIQEGMLFHSLLAPESGVYFQQVSFALTGSIKIPALKGAWERVIERYTILRTSFVWERRDKPLQVVRKQVKLPWEEFDLRGLPADEQQKRLDEFLHARNN